MIKIYLFTTLNLIFGGFSCIAQSNTTLFENDSIVISAQLQRCHKPSKGTDINYVYLTLENKTNVSLKVDYQIKKWYNEVCYGCDDNAEQKYQVTLSANQTLSGTCESSEKSTRIFDSMNDGMSDKKLTQYELELLTLKVVGYE